MQHSSQKNYSSGFSLLELSIMITVVSVITSGYLSWIQPPYVTNVQKAENNT